MKGREHPQPAAPLQGKHKETMKGMFDTRARDSKRFQEDLMQNLEDNKKRYDRSLYSDWIAKIYAKCTTACIRPATSSYN